MVCTSQHSLNRVVSPIWLPLAMEAETDESLKLLSKPGSLSWSLKMRCSMDRSCKVIKLATKLSKCWMWMGTLIVSDLIRHLPWSPFVASLQVSLCSSLWTWSTSIKLFHRKWLTSFELLSPKTMFFELEIIHSSMHCWLFSCVQCLFYRWIVFFLIWPNYLSCWKHKLSLSCVALRLASMLSCL